MTLVVSTTCWINCDACGESFGADTVRSASKGDQARLRREAKTNGWVHKNGGNLCPDCNAPNRKEGTPTL